jgi:hypothetical protein
MGRHIENPANFCRAEAYAGTGLETRLRAAGALLGDYFGFDYRIRDPRVESLHQIANYAFYDRNFNDDGLHYFNMQVDFFYQLLRRFHPELTSETLRAEVRNFIKRTNLDTFACVAQIYDFVAASDPADRRAASAFSVEMRARVKDSGIELRQDGEDLLDWMQRLYDAGPGVGRHVRPEAQPYRIMDPPPGEPEGALGGLWDGPWPYLGLDDLAKTEASTSVSDLDRLGLAGGAVPYDEFVRRLAE